VFMRHFSRPRHMGWLQFRVRECVYIERERRRLLCDDSSRVCVCAVFESPGT